jgi:hypothetical protein
VRWWTMVVVNLQITGTPAIVLGIPTFKRAFTDRLGDDEGDSRLLCQCAESEETSLMLQGGAEFLAIVGLTPQEMIRK